MTVRLHRDFVRSTLSSDLPASGAGSTTLHSAGLTGVGAVSGGAVLAVSIDPEATLGPPEIVHVTSLTAGANSGVITRGQEGTSATHYPAGTPWVHALTAWDIDAVSGTGGGGITFGPAPAPFVTTLADVADPDSWWGPAPVHFLTWTPTRSGVVTLAGPAPDADTEDREYLVWHGTTANVDYPDATAASGSFSGDSVADSSSSGGTAFPSSFRCVAGQAYTVTVVYWGSDPQDDRSVSLVELYQSLEPFGGVTPLIAPAAAAYAGVAPDGSLTLLPDPYDPTAGNTVSGAHAFATGTGNTASGDDSVASGQNTQATNWTAHAEGYLTLASAQSSHAEGDQAHATGDRSHAEGYLTIAAGSMSHAEGQQAHANGPQSHAEGSNTQAAGDQSHAEGNATFAGGFASHAEGYGGWAFRNGEHTQGAFETSVANRRVQASRLVFKLDTTDATPAVMADPTGGGSHTLNTRTAATFSGLVVAYRDTGTTHAAADAVVAGWRIDGVVYGGDQPDAVLVGATVTALHASTGAAAWTVAITIDGSGRFAFTVTGDVGHTVTWGAFIDLIEVGS